MASSTFNILLILVVCLVAASSANRHKQFRRRAAREVAAEPRTIDVGPVNTAVYASSTTKLDCAASLTGSPRVQWWEYVTVSSGMQISDGTMVLPGHPNSGRYSIEANEASQVYNLQISPTVMQDAGRYQCRDINAADSALNAELVMIEKEPNCTTTLPSNGIVTEGYYYTIECQVYFAASPGIAPVLYWTGPGTYQQVYMTTNQSAWSAVQFNVNKTMDGRGFQCLINFTTDGFGGPDTAGNAPSWSYTYRSVVLFVQYGPQNISITPTQETYEIGQVLTCNADAVPLPTYKWTNLVTMVEYNSQSLTITESMVGYNVLRCQVINAVSSANIFLNATVNARTTTSTPPPTTTTTAPPAVTPCDNLSGRWEAVRDATSTIVLCLNVDTSQNGLIRGLLQNDTNEPYLTEVIGRTRNNAFDEAGWTGIWPERIGVSSFAAECHRCYGTETMLVNLISRSSADSVFCDGGTVLTSPQFTFYRKPTTYPCSMSVAAMETNLEHANEQPRRTKH